MKSYENEGGDSAVVGFEKGEDSITIEFLDGAVYRYTYRNTGGVNVEQMKKYADIGHGLYGFLSRFIGKETGTRLN